VTHTVGMRTVYRIVVRGDSEGMDNLRDVSVQAGESYQSRWSVGVYVHGSVHHKSIL
jgi:hypothetical protein